VVVERALSLGAGPGFGFGVGVGLGFGFGPGFGLEPKAELERKVGPGPGLGLEPKAELERKVGPGPGPGPGLAPRVGPFDLLPGVVVGAVVAMGSTAGMEGPGNTVAALGNSKAPVVVPAGATVGMRLGTRACPHRRPRFGGAIVDKRWGSSTDRQPAGRFGAACGPQMGEAMARLVVVNESFPKAA